MNITLKMRGIWVCFGVVIFVTLLGVTTASAMTPIPFDLIDEFKADGRYDDWLEQVDRVKGYEISRDMASNKNILSVSGADSAAPPQRPETGNRWMPTEGTANALVICVEFPDQLHTTSQTISNMYDLMFGAENPQSPNYPYESVSAFYKRSSYNKLNITGEVWGWYMAEHNSSYYAQAEHNGNIMLVQEALNYYYSQGETFERFDEDKDGYIDALYIRYANRTNTVGGFWWAYMYYGDMDTYSIGGMKVYGYVFMPYNESSTGWTKPSRVAIHETGHLFGLPDLYDGNSSVGPRGGVGGCDIMDLNMGDHNAFSKFMLGWIEPTIISNGTQSVDLKPYATNPQALLIMPSASGSPLEEYYIAQYMTFEGNYSEYDELYTYSNLQYQTGSVRQYITTGVAIWHVDAAPNVEENFGFQYDNTFTTRKLIKLVEADGRNDIENPLYAATWDGYKASSDDFFIPGDIFNDTTTPNSKMYNGTNTGMNVSFLTKNAAYTRVNVTYPADNTAPSALTAFYNHSSDEIHVSVNAAITESANFSDIVLTQKKTGANVEATITLRENSLIITPQDPLEKGARYILNIPEDAFVNSNNISNSMAQFNIINETFSELIKDGYIMTNFIVAAKDNNDVELNSRFLSSNAAKVYGYVSLFNATNETKHVMAVLSLENNGKLETFKMGTYTVGPYSPLDAEISYIPVENVDLSRYKLLLWEEGNMQPIREIYIFE